MEGSLFVTSFSLDTAATDNSFFVVRDNNDSQQAGSSLSVLRGLKIAHFCLVEPSAEVIAGISQSNKQLILFDTVTQSVISQ